MELQEVSVSFGPNSTSTSDMETAYVDHKWRCWRMVRSFHDTQTQHLKTKGEVGIKTFFILLRQFMMSVKELKSHGASEQLLGYKPCFRLTGFSEGWPLNRKQLMM